MKPVLPFSSAAEFIESKATEQSDVGFIPTADVVSAQIPQLADGSPRIRKYPVSGIISYAQNSEDILLWRALHEVENGFYLDAGAQDPSHHSVTRAFYDRGWRGINIEPVAGYFEKLRKERPRDLTLRVALGDREGWATLHEFPDTGLSTLVESVAAGHRANGLRSVERRVPICTLANIWKEFADKEVHFLKVDVEGFEHRVLAGANLARLRPWIIVIEATEPNTPKGAWGGWEPILLTSGYQFVYFDGLNRWYLAEEKSNLKRRFEVPPNVFDGFELSTVVSLQAAIESLQHRVATAECAVKRIHSSVSWRITEPLRFANDTLRAAARWALRTWTDRRQE